MSIRTEQEIKEMLKKLEKRFYSLNYGRNKDEIISLNERLITLLWVLELIDDEDVKNPYLLYKNCKE